MASPYPNEHYTIAWVSPLDIESCAATALLDEVHGYPQTPVGKNDGNTYALGKMGQFNVVIAHLPAFRIGSFSAARVITDLVRSFTGVRIGFLVGIGAGIPDFDADPPRDIRLGDVVVGCHHKCSVRVYDFGKRHGDGSFEEGYELCPPPEAVLSALGRLRSDHRRQENKISEYVKLMLKKNPRMIEDYAYPGRLEDRLFQADYPHQSGSSCRKCDPNKQIFRKKRPDTEPPVVHYGPIATGSSVVKHAPTREEIRTKLGAICLEMEAAGLMNKFPCIVIRGISDYADSHKNDQWQGYAAATAAALAKELLECVQPTAVDGAPRVRDILNEGDGVSRMVATADRGQKVMILNWLTTSNYGAQQSDFFGRRQEGTGEWLLHSAEFQKWLNQSRQVLLCPGMPGAGKTIITAIVIDHIWAKFCSDISVGVAYLYCSYKKEHKSVDLFASLLRQLIQERPSVPEIVKTLYERHEDRQTRPSLNEVLNALHSVAAYYSRIFIIVDALDECRISDGGRSQFLSEIHKLRVKTGANFFATSRSSPEITRHFDESISLEVRASDEDVRRYLDSRISHAESRIIQRPDLKEETIAKITKSADGMFLLAKLRLDAVIGMRLPKDIKAELEERPGAPKAYDDEYHRAMVRVKEQGFKCYELAIHVLAWITCSKRLLTISELRHALAVEPDAPELDEEGLPEIEDMVSVCAGLVTIDGQSGIICLVHKTTQEYFERTWTSWFPNVQTNITRTCVTYLSFSNFESGFCPTDEEFEARLRSYVLYDYAARNWGHHARAASAEVEQLILDFLENDAKVSSCSQAATISRYYYGGSQTVPKQMTGLHLAAYFGLRKAVVALLKSGHHHPNAKDAFNQTPLLWAARNGHLEVVKLLLDKGGVDLDSKDTRYGRTPLSWAAEDGHGEVVKLLLGRRGVDPDSKDTRYDNMGMTPLSRAAESGHGKVVKLLLSKDGVDPNFKDHLSNRTPLSWAAEYGQREVVKLLLDENRVDPDPRDGPNRTPLSWAAWNGHVEVVKLLLDRSGVDPDSRDSEHGRTPLSWAAEYGHIEVVKLLLDKSRVGLNFKDTEHGWTPLWWASENQHREVVKLLLDKDGVDPDSKDWHDRTLLSRAAENGDGEMVKLLLDSDGVDPDLKDSRSDRTPLLWAAWKGHWEVVKLLLNKDGVDPESKDKYGRTLLSRAAEEGHQEVVELLLNEVRVDPDPKDKNGMTPLSWAAGNGHRGVVKLLLEKDGVDPDSKDKRFNQSPLWLAAGQGYTEVVKLLLEKDGVDPDSRDSIDGRTSLSLAAEKGYGEVVKLLLNEDGVDPDSKETSTGRTPLSQAAEKGQTEMVKLLLDRDGVDPDPKDEYGRTPLSWAAEEGHGEIVKLLLDTDEVDLDNRDSDFGLTPLLWAAKEGRVEVVKLLLDEGRVSLDSLDSIFGRTPLSWAAEQGHDEVVKLLLEKHAEIPY
ncbi:hypothetical protein GP486_002538 [Trichoglossum hirsutum]|uniref:Nucleoside phosphorylase domain-containing protein n=1 Tax=Trichoglossum hirsutum TaxID=265104 RepID=A0A9P8LER5_9PEZI|nr:hypothetical protein GP486_002538 [Trichoglossum hirsutum]